MNYRIRSLSLLLLLLAGKVHGQTTISWCSFVNSTNIKGGGGEMDTGFQFQLGVFTSGFVPTPSNMSEWTNYWVSAQTTDYNPITKSFTSDFIVTNNVAPFSYGAKGYIWGRKTTTVGSEWILMRNTNWTWPTPDSTGLSPFNLTWNFSSSNEIILGNAHSSGSPFLMKSEVIESFDQWKNSKLAGEPMNGPDQDPDHDGRSNLIEFAFGTLPLQADSVSSEKTDLATVSGERYLQITIPRQRNHLSSISVEVSSDLKNWYSGTSNTVEVANTPNSLVVRDLTPGGPGMPRRFMRAKAVVPSP